MKYTFAIALLVGFLATETTAISLSAEPVAKKEEPKVDEAALKAKLDANSAKKKEQDDKAKDAETKSMNEKEAEEDRKTKYVREVYEKNIADQEAETKRIK